MKKAANGISALYPKLTSITCVAHGVYRLAEYIQSLYPDIDIWVSNLKKIFLKAPSRVGVFRENAPGLALPPKPILTRWGTWIESVVYSATSFYILEKVLMEVDDGDTISIKKCRNIMKLTQFRTDIIFLSSNYGFIAEVIEKIQKSNLPLYESLAVIEDIKQKISKIPGEKAKGIQEKFERIINKNEGIAKLKIISDLLVGESPVKLSICLFKKYVLLNMLQLLPVT